MRFKFVAALLGAFACFWSATAWSQNTDPQADFFLNAFQAFQKGSDLENAGKLPQALQAYQEADQTLDQIKKRWPNWNPSIVEFRQKKTGDAIARVQQKVNNKGVGPLPSPEPVIPGTTGRSGPSSPDSVGAEPNLPTDGAAEVLPDRIPEPPSTPKGRGTRKTTASTGDTEKDPLKQIAQERKELEAKVEEARRQLDEAQAEREKIEKENAKLRKTKEESEQKMGILQQRADIAEKALSDARNKGTQTDERVQVLTTDRDKSRRELSQAREERDAAALLASEYATRDSNRQKIAVDLKSKFDSASAASKEAAAKLEKATKETDKRVEAATASTTAELAAEKKKFADLEKEDAAKIAEVQKKAAAAGAEAQHAADAALTSAQQKLDKALKELDDVKGKLVAVTKERDDVRDQLTKLKDAQKHVDQLLNDNQRLTGQLAEAEQKIKQFKSDGEEKDRVIAGLKMEVTEVRGKLAEAQKQSAAYQTQMAGLQAKLDTQAKDLQQAKADNTAGVAERKQMTAENEMLRGIVLRQMKEQARRDQTRKLVLDQMAKMEIRSKDLITQINYLGQPVLKLTEKERALFKKAQVEFSENEISAPLANRNAAEPPLPVATPEPPAPEAPAPAPVSPPEPKVAKSEPPATSAPAPAPEAPTPAAKATPAVAKAPPAPPKAAPASATPKEEKVAMLEQKPSEPKAAPPATEPAPPAPEKPETSAGGQDSPTPYTGDSSKGATGMPPELLPLVQEGKDQFERGNYREAEKAYEKILQKVPTNVYALSNLGVVQFRAGKLKPAEASFRKAIAIAPEDGFSHCTIGIIYYTETKYDDAVNELTKALAINPKNAIAHNYLGITASQKGWQEAAQKELETATVHDPNYADAWFNLAVVHATHQPPDKEEARRCYKKAVELGAEADASLEQLIK